MQATLERHDELRLEKYDESRNSKHNEEIFFRTTNNNSCQMLLEADDERSLMPYLKCSLELRMLQISHMKAMSKHK